MHKVLLSLLFLLLIAASVNKVVQFRGHSDSVADHQIVTYQSGTGF